MRSICYLVLTILPVLVLSQKCPTFQSVISLRPSATSSNFSYAIVAQGKYYLVDINDQSHKQLSPNGVLPKGFEESRLITLIDRYDCNQSEYHLIAIKSFRLSETTIHVNYTTLDLMNWNHSTKWSEPKAISEHPLFSNDQMVKVLSFGGNLMIEDIIHTMFYWNQKKTLFIVIKPFQSYSETPLRSKSLRYYTIDAKNGCDQNYLHSKTESLVEAISPLIEPLDLCFFSHKSIVSDSILYCIGGQSFQANTILQTPEKHSLLRTVNIGSPEEMPTIDRLKIFSRICIPKVRESSVYGMSDRIRVHIDENIPREDFGSKSIPEKDVIMKEEAPIQELTLVQTVPSNGEEVSSLANSESGDSSSTTFIIILICLAIFVLIMIGILIIAARRQQQIAKM